MNRRKYFVEWCRDVSAIILAVAWVDLALAAPDKDKLWPLTKVQWMVVLAGLVGGMLFFVVGWWLEADDRSE